MSIRIIIIPTKMKFLSTRLAVDLARKMELSEIPQILMNWLGRPKPNRK